MIRCNIVKHIKDPDNPNVKTDETKSLNPEIIDHISSAMVMLTESNESKESDEKIKDNIG